MKRTVFLIAVALLMLPAMAPAQNVMVTRNFTGLWDQPAHESQGLNLQIIDQASGEKLAVAYWFTYGNDQKTAWFLGVGAVDGNRVEMLLFDSSGVAFLEDDSADNDHVTEVGTMELEFFSCDEGEATFMTDVPAVGSGSFQIERFTDLFNTRCSGGVSDDTAPDVLETEQRIALVPARGGVIGSGHADFEERPDRTKFSVEVEDIPDGSYRIFVDGMDRGPIMVSLGMGETEFRSPAEPGKILLTFDPRGAQIEVRDNQGAILTSGEAVFDTGGDDNGDDDNGGGDNGGDDNGGDDNGGDDNGGDDNGGDDNGGDDNGGGGDQDFGSMEIEVELDNTGVYPLASGDAELRPREDRTDFSVEIEDVPEGDYGLRVGGQSVGTIRAVMQVDGTIEGELEFRDPVEPGKQLLDFDPRGQSIEVLDGTTVILETMFPSG